jgi:hypothetical protein
MHVLPSNDCDVKSMGGFSSHALARALLDCPDVPIVSQDNDSGESYNASTIRFLDMVDEEHPNYLRFEHSSFCRNLPPAEHSRAVDYARRREAYLAWFDTMPKVKAITID